MNPMKPGTVQLGNASIHIGYSGIVEPHQRGLARELTEFFVPEEHRGKGEGTALLEDVCAQADYHQIMLIIIADTTRLENFYSRFGFKTIQEAPVCLMVRPPMLIGQMH